MSEANVANTTTILGRTNAVPVFTHWKTIVFNDPSNQAAIKINSLFVVNRAVETVNFDMRLAREPYLAPGALYSEGNSYTYLMKNWALPMYTTAVVISRDNPIWLQPGDFIQVAGGLNYCLEALCSYEFISDISPAPSITFTVPEPVLNLNAAPVYGSEGVQLTWSPPLADGGLAISNYLVFFRCKVVFATSPYTELWTGWNLLERPVSSIPNLTTIKSVLLSRPRSLSGINAAYSPLSIDLKGGTFPIQTDTDPRTGDPIFTDMPIVGFQFQVAAYNAAGLGQWGDPSDLIRLDAIGMVGDETTGTSRVGVIEAISLTALPNGVSLSWENRIPKITPDTNETITIVNYRIRWSNDNGITWLPSPHGSLIGVDTVDPDPEAHVRGLQNGIDYIFSLQAVCERTKADYTDRLTGPWSPPTRSMTPPGFPSDAQALAAIRTMFVRWV